MRLTIRDIFIHIFISSKNKQSSGLSYTGNFIHENKASHMKFAPVFHQRLPGWILAVLPIFHFSSIPLLIETEVGQMAVPIQHRDKGRRHFLKMGNTASIQPGSLLQECMYKNATYGPSQGQETTKL